MEEEPGKSLHSAFRRRRVRASTHRGGMQSRDGQPPDLRRPVGAVIQQAARHPRRRRRQRRQLKRAAFAATTMFRSAPRENRSGSGRDQNVNSSATSAGHRVRARATVRGPRRRRGRRAGVASWDTPSGRTMTLRRRRGGRLPLLPQRPARRFASMPHVGGHRRGLRNCPRRGARASLAVPVPEYDAASRSSAALTAISKRPLPIPQAKAATTGSWGTCPQAQGNGRRWAKLAVASCPGRPHSPGGLGRDWQPGREQCSRSGKVAGPRRHVGRTASNESRPGPR